MLRSGPLEHQVPATVQRKEATPAATKNNKPSGRAREEGGCYNIASPADPSLILTLQRKRKKQPTAAAAKTASHIWIFFVTKKKKKIVCRKKLRHLSVQLGMIQEQ